MNTVADVLKAKCEELSAEVKKQADFINQANNALKQLRAERKLALAKIQEYNGGIIAYNSTLNLMNAGQAPVQTEEVSPVVEGEVVSDTDTVAMD